MKREVPPEMVFDQDEDEVSFEITEQGPRPRPRRHESAWDKQAATWAAPTFHFTCCGTRYGAMTPAALSVTRQVHERAVHADHP